MNIIPAILDSRPGYLKGAPLTHSLLTLPVGTGSVLGEIALRAEAAGLGECLVIPTFEPGASYAGSILGAAGGSSVKVVSRDQLGALGQQYEPSDVLLIMDPRYWPIGGFDFSSIVQGHSADIRWAVHGVAMVSAPEGTQEYVHRDSEGRVQRVGRYYDRVTCSQIGAVAYSLVPFTSWPGTGFETLEGLRSVLSGRGLLSRDVSVSSGVIDLGEARGLLTLNEEHAVGAVRGREASGYSYDDRGMLLGHNCRVHPSARIVSPVILHAGVTVEEGATLLGPTVVGGHSTIQRGAMIAQAVLAGGARVAPGQVIRQQMGIGRSVADGSQVVAFPGSRESTPGGLVGVDSQGIRLGADASVIRSVKPRRTVYPRIKLAADVAVAAVSLVILSPLLALTAIAIKLESPGPVFFGHEREGVGGGTFRCLKFRTMFRDAHRRQRELYSTNALDGPQFKLHNDPRVTRVGAWLRATNIDELPQLINVLLGQMSIVGPRPSPFRENQICVPWRRARLSVRPGITGLWQICRDQRSEGDFHQWIAYDIMYVRHMSFALDLKILLATVLTLGGTWNIPPHWLVREPRPFGGGARQAA